jgi:hypothetical protein
LDNNITSHVDLFGLKRHKTEVELRTGYEYGVHKKQKYKCTKTVKKDGCGDDKTSYENVAEGSSTIVSSRTLISTTRYMRSSLYYETLVSALNFNLWQMTKSKDVPDELAPMEIWEDKPHSVTERSISTKNTDPTLGLPGLGPCNADRLGQTYEQHSISDKKTEYSDWEKY